MSSKPIRPIRHENRNSNPTFLRFPIAIPPRAEKGSNAKRDVAAFCQERSCVRRFHFFR